MSDAVSNAIRDLRDSINRAIARQEDDLFNRMSIGMSAGWWASKLIEQREWRKAFHRDLERRFGDMMCERFPTFEVWDMYRRHQWTTVAEAMRIKIDSHIERAILNGRASPIFPTST